MSNHPHRSGFVAIVGEANAGKSTLLNALLKRKIAIVSPRAQTTRNRILGVKHGDNYQIVFLDTPGFVRKEKNSELNRFISHAATEAAGEGDLLLLVLDGPRASRDREHVSSIAKLLQDKKLRQPSVIAINKIDKIPHKEKLLELIASLTERFKGAEGQVPVVVPISALECDGLELLERELVQQLPEGPAYFPEDMLTDQTERFVAAEIIREKLFFKLKEELPYSCAVQVENWTEEAKLLRIEALVTVEQESQKGIVIGRGGAMLKEIGTAARQELERLFGTKIHLQIFVRVEKKWSHTRKGLKRVGVDD